jgi:hypothetical protein
MKLSRYCLGFYLGVSLLGSSLNAQPQSASAPPIIATVPRLVNFSGKTTDPQGKAISGIAGVTFAIYKDRYEGAPLWLETQNIQADAKGNYTAQLGTTKPDGLPLDLFSSGEARWLAVTVNGGQEQPRVLLLSVPYALKAADAETIGGLPPSAFVLAAPATSSTSSKAVGPASSTSAASAPTTNPAVTGVGAAGLIPLWDSSSDIVSSALFQSGSGATAKMGINTTTPASTLDVKGSETVRGNLGLPATGTYRSTVGVTGLSDSPSGIGVYGQNGSASIVSGFWSSPVGVWGDGGISASVPLGVLGTVDDGEGGIFENNSATGYSALEAYADNRASLTLYAKNNASGGHRHNPLPTRPDLRPTARLYQQLLQTLPP